MSNKKIRSVLNIEIMKQEDVFYRSLYKDLRNKKIKEIIESIHYDKSAKGKDISDREFIENEFYGER